MESELLSIPSARRPVKRISAFGCSITLSYFGFVKPFALQDMRTSPLRMNRRPFPLICDKYFREIGDAGRRSVCWRKAPKLGCSLDH